MSAQGISAVFVLFRGEGVARSRGRRQQTCNLLQAAKSQASAPHLSYVIILHTL